MKFLKKHKINLLFVLILALIVFTPLGFKLKVLIHKYIHFNPSEIAIEKQVTLNNYNWNLTDGKGVQINFNAYKNKVIIINFWATWCPPCVAEMPSFQELYEKYQDEVVFLFVANDKTEKVNTFMQKNNFTFTNYYEVSPTPPELVSSSIPTTFIIDKKGRIVMQKKGATNWNSDYINSFLKKIIEK
jgi:thiol-disulfide isomerase/thioredoxin